MEINWKGLGWVLLLLLLCFAALAVMSAYAENESYAIIEYEGGLNDTLLAKNGTPGNPIISVGQGDTIYWYDVADLRLVEGWYEKLVHQDTGRIVDISSYTNKILIAPDIFTPGEWHQWSPFEFEETQGNTLAFIVNGTRRPVLTFENNTNVTEPETHFIKSYVQPIPVKHVASFLVARGDTLTINATDEAKFWIFGQKEGYYGVPAVNGTFHLNESQVRYLSPGNYKLVIEQAGPQSITVNMRYNQTADRIDFFNPSTFEIEHLDMMGLDPVTRLDQFREIRNRTQDIFTDYTLVVEDPYIEIISLDQTYHRNDTTAQTVRGYTNVAINTTFTVVVDPDKFVGRDLRFSTFNGTVQGNPRKPGDARWFEISLPILFENVAAGPHTITITTDIGGSMNVNYLVYESPESSFIPNNTIKYVNGSEWRPDPTPIVVTQIVTQEIIKTQTILIPVTPSQESVEKAQYDALYSLVILGVAIIVVVVILIFAVWYLINSHKRLREEQEKE